MLGADDTSVGNANPLNDVPVVPIPVVVVGVCAPLEDATGLKQQVDIGAQVE